LPTRRGWIGLFLKMARRCCDIVVVLSSFVAPLNFLAIAYEWRCRRRWPVRRLV